VAIARFKKVCIDAVDPEQLGVFWAAALHRTWEADGKGEGGVFGPTPQHTLWFNRVSQAKTVKHRVHLDIYTEDLAALRELGAWIVLPEGDDRRWTVMADPEGGEFCAYLRAHPPAERLHGLVVDSADPPAQARWWADVFGAPTVTDDEHGWSTVAGIPGMPIQTFDFNVVPEPKAAPNRVHWDVEVDDVNALSAAGATVLRAPDAEIDWHIMADPEGNEFCAFAAG
jgi:hypothetical protein